MNSEGRHNGGFVEQHLDAPVRIEVTPQGCALAVDPLRAEQNAGIIAALIADSDARRAARVAKITGAHR